MREWTPPASFDGYEVVRLLGRGGMGQVFLARDTLLDRSVAVKFISGADRGTDARKRFLLEARAIARLQHPNVVSIYRVGEVDGCPYLVSELIRGRGLDTIPKPMPWQRVLELAAGIASGLAAAHRRGVVHRDIKPANAILSDDGDVKLLDFGIAKLLDAASDLRISAAPGRRTSFPSLGPVETPTAFSCAAAIEDVPSSTPDDVTAPVEATAIGATDGACVITGGCPIDRARIECGAPLDPWLTRPGIALGTPMYMAPEVWRGEPATFRSDVYSLGALVYTLCTGHPPHAAPTLGQLREVVESRDAAPLATRTPSSGASPDAGFNAFAAVIDRCLRRDPAARFASASELRSALALLTPDARVDVVPEGNPYRGLAAFEAEHRALYFGRDGEIRAILDRLATEPLIVVAGDSGVGKSSFCRAGVLPRIQAYLGKGGGEKALDGASRASRGNRAWSVATLVPGKNPVTALAVALAPHLAHLAIAEDEIARMILEDAPAIGRELRLAMGAERGVIIFVDQLEELVTLAATQESTAFAEAIAWLGSPAPGIRVVATVRGDFLSRVASIPGFADAISRALFFLRPLSQERIREAIVGPARATGVSFETESMIDALTAGAGEAEGALPLLQFALAELWEARDATRQIIPASALEALGGVSGALSRHADALLGRMLPLERAAARPILLRLVSEAGTRMRRAGDDLVAGLEAGPGALDALVRGRLVVAGDTPEGATYELTHEALIHGWETLVRWRSADAGAQLARERLARAVVEWERLGRAEDALWSARQLREIGIPGGGGGNVTGGLVDPASLTQRQLEFVARSRRRVHRGRLLRAGVFAVVPVIAGLAYGGSTVTARRDLARKVDAAVATGRALLADVQHRHAELRSARSRAYALYDKPDQAAGEEAWGRATSLEGALLPAFGRASQALEGALALDRGRGDVRALFADLLYERALVADELRKPSERDELLARLALYDDGGTRRRRWDAPATLSLAAGPGGASITIARYVADTVDEGRGADGAPGTPTSRRLEPLGTFASPIVDLPLPRGSYLATIDVRGAATAKTPSTTTTVRYPFVVERSERAHHSVDLPRPASVPEGFVFVPAGRFFFGADVEDGLRRGFFHTIPIHPMSTGPFLIARHETTFADWIEFLRALEPAARATRLPSVKGGFQGALAVRELAETSRWSIDFQPSTQRYGAKSGESVVYPGRTVRKTQDWLRFPVFGVTADDAAAYASWLDRSGRVVGARLCTEREWERGARGADDRLYPHGDGLAPDDASFDETYGKLPTAIGPDEVGSHPKSRSPFGLDDMAGNVWEWTRSSLVEGEHAARGGSYYFDVNTSRTYNREVTEASFRDVTVGFRVCADAPASRR